MNYAKTLYTEYPYVSIERYLKQLKLKEIFINVVIYYSENPMKNCAGLTFNIETEVALWKKTQTKYNKSEMFRKYRHIDEVHGALWFDLLKKFGLQSYI